MHEVKLFEGDNRESLRRLIDQGVRVHSVVTDPPYGLVSVQKRFGKEGSAAARTEGNDGSFARLSGGFMGKVWDGTGIERDPEFWKLIYEILLPGGYVFAFSGSRTGHWQACAMEVAGFVMHPMHGWTFGSGFPKAHNAAMAIDKMFGAKHRAKSFNMKGKEDNPRADEFAENGREILPPWEAESPEAAQWEGWAYGTQAQKPALEPIYLGQKPFSEKTGAANLLKHGVGAVNIDATRVPLNDSATYGCSARSSLPDSKVCTCPSHEAIQTNRIEGRSTQVSSSLEPDDLDDLLSSVEPHARQTEAVQGSRADCQTYRHCDDEPAHEEEDRAQDASTSQGDASILPVRCAKCGCIREDLSKPYLEYTARHVENKGRHPSNLILDGSPEVVAMFPDSKSGAMKASTARSAQDEPGSVCYGTYGGQVASQDIAASSGSAARFFHQFTPDHYDEVDVTWSSDAKFNQARLLVDTEQSPPKVIAASGSAGSSEWNTFLFGSGLTDLCLTDSKSIIATKTRSTTASKTLNWLMRSLTNASTGDVFCETVSGSNHAGAVEQCGTSQITMIAKTAFRLGANRVASGTQLQISVCARSFADPLFYHAKAGKSDRSGSVHPTVKPIALMQYLIRHITPPGGTVLDPFAGSGTTAEAARREGFDCILMEAEAEYIDFLRERFLLKRPMVNYSHDLSDLLS